MKKSSISGVYEFKNKILLPGRQKNIESLVNIFDVGVLLTTRGKFGEGISNTPENVVTPGGEQE